MQPLRNTHFMARLVLAWFGLFLAVSVLTTIVKPATIQAVCSGSGVMKVVVSDENGDRVEVPRGMDCPLCSSIAGPLPTAEFTQTQPSPLAYSLQFIASAHIAALTAPPLPSRGPPARLT